MRQLSPQQRVADDIHVVPGARQRHVQQVRRAGRPLRGASRAVVGAQDQHHHALLLALEGVHGAHHLAGPLPQFARRGRLAVAEAAVPVHVHDPRAQFVAHRLEGRDQVHGRQLAVAAVQFQQHFQHEVELQRHHLLVADGADGVDPAARAARQATAAGRRQAVGQAIHHLVFIGDGVGQREHRLDAAAMHAQRAAYPQRMRAAGMDPRAVAVGLVGQRLHRGGGGRIAAVLRMFRQGRQRLHQPWRHGKHRFDLQRIAYHHRAFGAPDAADGRLRHGLARFIDKQPAQRLGAHALELARKRGKRGGDHRHRHEQALPDHGDMRLVVGALVFQQFRHGQQVAAKTGAAFFRHFGQPCLVQRQRLGKQARAQARQRRFMPQALDLQRVAVEFFQRGRRADGREAQARAAQHFRAVIPLAFARLGAAQREVQAVAGPLAAWLQFALQQQLDGRDVACSLALRFGVGQHGVLERARRRGAKQLGKKAGFGQRHQAFFFQQVLLAGQ